ncbi:MAG: UDP-3-O-acyl-N-acetylglucosamine deacetylase [bacterium]
MSEQYPVGRILAGSEAAIRAARDRMLAQAIDQTDLCPGDTGFSPRRTTLGGVQSVTGPGTFYRRAQRTLVFKPSAQPGWWIERTDQQEQLGVAVSARNIWTSQRNIVLRSGSPHNYLRMVEHIVALRLGLGLDDVVVATGAGDPPLFDRGSMDLVEAVEAAGIVEQAAPATFVTVREPVTIGGDRGDFITLLPAAPGDRRLRLDCAVDFASAIGKQRILFDLTPRTFRHGAAARTNASLAQMILCKTVGVLFADMRNLGYDRNNILIHSRRSYYNEPRLVHNGKALEPVWHRATLDLLAALALIDTGRFAGTVVSYRAGHTLDCRLVTLLCRHGLLNVMPAGT